MTKLLLTLVFSLFILVKLDAQSRREIQIPDIPGYMTLKCDFHTHTVFSDGDVWPTVRVSEAWQQGLDAIAITDHIEYRPHLQDIKSDHNRSYEIAKPLAEQLGLILIRGTEITRKMPPGHLNAIFIKNANLIERDDWFDACLEAKDQGAFVFWNHPGWKAQQPDRTLWWSQHTRLLETGILGGIEIFNGHEFYPEALKWAKEKGLTILANSDIHNPAETNNDQEIDHRPITLVFATERKAESIRYALDNKNTAAYFENKLIGKRKFLLPIFQESIKITTDFIQLENNVSRYLQIHNHSDITYVLKGLQTTVGYSYQNSVELKAHRTSVIEITGNSEEIKNSEKLKLDYEVENLIDESGEKLKISIDVNN